jgi:hypothetical protein
MARSEAELRLQRKNTDAFIRANPSMIVLTPHTATKTGAGTQMVPGQARAPQRMRVIDQTRTFGAQPGTQTGGDGTQARYDYQLLGYYDATVAKDDRWVDSNGIEWQIKDLLPDNGYERRAQVVRYGGS